MKQIFHHYKAWEDYQNGMYNTSPETSESIEMARRTLAMPEKCSEAMHKVIQQWPICTEVNLSNTGNQRPWLGRAACCIYNGTTENITRIAWWRLTKEEQDTANDIADAIINKWRKELIEKQNPTLF